MSETIKKMCYLSVTGFFCAIFWVANLTDAIADERPNIVIILADDLGWADVGYPVSYTHLTLPTTPYV